MLKHSFLSFFCYYFLHFTKKYVSLIIENFPEHRKKKKKKKIPSAAIKRIDLVMEFQDFCVYCRSPYHVLRLPAIRKHRNEHAGNSLRRDRTY